MAHFGKMMSWYPSEGQFGDQWWLICIQTKAISAANGTRTKATSEKEWHSKAILAMMAADWNKKKGYK